MTLQATEERLCAGKYMTFERKEGFRVQERVHRGVDGPGSGQEPRRDGVPPGRERGRAVTCTRARASSGVRREQDPGAPRRAGTRDRLPRAVGRRRRPDPGEPRLSRRDVERDRPVQGWAPLPPERVRRPAEVPGVRAGAEERPHDAPHGRRQGRRRLRPEGQDRGRGDALLPVVHDRAAAAHRAVHRHPGR